MESESNFKKDLPIVSASILKPAIQPFPWCECFFTPSW